MSQIREFLNRHALLFGLALMFLFTWPIDLAHSGILPFHVPFAVYITLGYGFVLASVLMTWLTVGRKAVLALLKRFLIWRVHVRWYLVALFLFPSVQLLAVVLSVVVTSASADFDTVFARQIFGPSAALPLFIVPYLLFDALTNGEEIGWRGYVLPRLQARHNALVASLVVGMLWGLWHLPKFLALANTGLFAWFMVRIILEAVLYTWLYNNTQGSLLLTTLFHAAGNTGGAFLPVATTVSGANTTELIFRIAAEAILAVAVVMTAGPATLSRSKPKQVLD